MVKPELTMYQRYARVATLNIVPVVIAILIAIIDKKKIQALQNISTWVIKDAEEGGCCCSSTSPSDQYYYHHYD